MAAATPKEPAPKTPAPPKAPAPQLYVLAEEGCEAPVAPPRVNRLPPEGGHESLLAAAGVKGVAGALTSIDPPEIHEEEL